MHAGVLESSRMPTMVRPLWRTDGTSCSLSARRGQQRANTSQAMDSNRVIVDSVIAYPRKPCPPRLGSCGFYWCEWYSRHQSHRERFRHVRKTRILLVEKGVMGASLSVTPIIISVLVSISVSNQITYNTYRDGEQCRHTTSERELLTSPPVPAAAVYTVIVYSELARSALHNNKVRPEVFCLWSPTYPPHRTGVILADSLQP